MVKIRLYFIKLKFLLVHRLDLVNKIRSFGENSIFVSHLSLVFTKLIKGLTKYFKTQARVFSPPYLFKIQIVKHFKLSNQNYYFNKNSSNCSKI